MCLPASLDHPLQGLDERLSLVVTILRSPLGSLIMAAPRAVFTSACVAKMVGEDEDED